MKGMIPTLEYPHNVFTKPTALKWVKRGGYPEVGDTLEAAERYRLPRSAAAVLLGRGIDDIPQFLTKSRSKIRHPSDLPDFEAAVLRIREALINKEKMVVYGDYDVDGMTSVAVVTECLNYFCKPFPPQATYYIPDRVNEGYGLNSDAIRKLAAEGNKIIITVDCGITSVEEAKVAKECGVDLIITDHHTCMDTLPEAIAVVNPKRRDYDVPFRDLAGVGVAFKLCLAVALNIGYDTNRIFNDYCDLVAIGTVADVVPLVDENRIIVAKGLEKLASGANVGINALLDQMDMRGKLTATTISFGIAPKLNAAGRLGDPTMAVRLLTTNDPEEAHSLAAQLDELSTKRRELENEVYNEIMNHLVDKFYQLSHRIIVVCGYGWNHGVIGRVAAMISERFNKPCVVVSFENGKGKGSCRGIEGFDMVEALRACSEYLDEFGGHKAAAGLSIKRENWVKFRGAMYRYAKKVFPELKDMAKPIHVDCEIFPHEITLENARILSLLEPYGTDNPKPVFFVKNIEIESITRVGADKSHLKAVFKHKDMHIDAIGFKLAYLFDHFQEGNRVDCVFTMDINSFNGNETVQMRILDLKWGNRSYFEE